MMDVARNVCEALPNVEIFVAGFGSLEDQVQRKWEKLPNRIKEQVVVGSYPDVAPILASAKVFVSLQQVENYPSQAILEAMACKCAIIATDVGDTRLFIDETVGALVDFDAKGISNKIIELFQNPEHLHTLGETAYQRATNDYTIGRFVEYVKEIYKGISCE